MKNKKPSSPRILVGLAVLATGLASAFAAGETVTIDAIAGGGFVPYIANEAGTAQNGVTVRVGSFLSANQSTVEALGYNRLWVGDQFSMFGTGTTATINSQSGSFDPNPNLTNTSDSFKGQRAWWVYANNATFGSATEYGVVSSTDAGWTIPNANPWSTAIDSSEVNILAFGSITGTDGNDSLRMAAVPSGNLYWDSNAAAGRGGSGTWSSSNTQLGWTTNASGLAADGTYAWGSTSGSAYYAGAGLTANFGGTGGTVTVSGTVETRHGIRVDAAFTFDPAGGGTIDLAGANATANFIKVDSGGSATVNAALSGSNGFTKEGAAALILQADNSSLTGAVVVTEGNVQANAANALGGATSVTVSNTGSLLISEDNAVNNAATVNLAGGKLAMGGTTNDTLGALTLSANSVIDLGSFSGNLSFAASNGASWTVNTTLSIWNWNGTSQYGTSYGAGDRHIFFGSNASGLLSSQLNQISFYSDNGNSFIGKAWINSYGEIGAVPEPEAIVTAVVLLLGSGFVWVRRRMAQMGSSECGVGSLIRSQAKKTVAS